MRETQIRADGSWEKYQEPTWVEAAVSFGQ